MQHKNPTNGVMNILRDRLNQALAELSLEQIDSQFPIDVILTHPSDGSPTTIRNQTIEMIEDIVSHATIEGVYPVEQIDPRYRRLKPHAPVLSALPLQVGERTRIFDISKKISSGTAQGTVYTVDLHPNVSLHYVTALDGLLGKTSTVTAVMKKSPIFDVLTWYKYIAAKKLRRFLTHNRSESPLANEDLRAAFSLAVVPLEQLSAVGIAGLDEYIRSKESALQKQYGDINNDAYVDTVGYFLGSELQVNGISPFFPLFYGSFRVFDSAYFDQDVVRTLGPEVNDGFPVQTTILQPLRETFNKLAKSQFFYRHDGSLDPDRLWSMLAQVVFGLDVAQHAFGLVHNDFHGGNLMYEQFPEDHSIYYRRVGTDAYYRVPTYGKVYKMIDFGRATYDLNGFRFGSISQDVAVGGQWRWALEGRNNDLYRFATIVISEFGLFDKEYIQDPHEDRFVTMIRSIVSCHGKSPWDWLPECENISPQLESRVKEAIGRSDEGHCHDYMINVRPYLIDEGCNDAIPKNNLHWFDHFRIGPEDVPPGAIVYSIF